MQYTFCISFDIFTLIPLDANCYVTNFKTHNTWRNILNCILNVNCYVTSLKTHNAGRYILDGVLSTQITSNLNKSEFIEDMPQSRSTAFLNSINATYETTAAQTRRTITGDPLWNGR